MLLELLGLRLLLELLGLRLRLLLELLELLELLALALALALTAAAALSSAASLIVHRTTLRDCSRTCVASAMALYLTQYAASSVN